MKKIVFCGIISALVAVRSVATPTKFVYYSLVKDSKKGVNQLLHNSLI